MAVTDEDIKYVADLAKLQLSGEEVKQLRGDMNQILGYIETLNELDTDSVEPLEHVTDLDTHFRRDEAKDPVSHEDALKNAPDADSDYFRVPRVID
ncbi:MAG: Asp-tRNA(Asn)/Glu-tRNA(Gln) amidotransferase subunit GatC [Balneolaceae bacterium]